MGETFNKVKNFFKFLGILITVMFVLYVAFWLYYIAAIVAYVVAGLMIAGLIYLFVATGNKKE